MDDRIDAPESQTPNDHHSLRQHGGRASLHYRSAYATVPSYRSTAGRGILRRQELGSSIVENAHGFPYLRKLQAHKSCVNALAFSSGGGQFLASGGDDLRIFLWNFYQDDVKSPSYTLRGPKGNIFCLEFSATNRFLFSGGTDQRIYKYDIAHLATPIAHPTHLSQNRIYQDHGDTIRAITSHPTQDEIFLSASEDGSIILHDDRQPSRTADIQNTIQTEVEVTGVKYHPMMEHLFATSSGAGEVFLRDSRMAFGPRTERSQEGIVQTYSTKLTKKSYHHLSNPDASSIAFDQEGTKLAVTFLHYLPTIYSLSDPNPIAVLSGKNLPDGTPIPPNQRTYSNSCTMKHGSFGGADISTGDMYAGGSDDFRGYIWKIPPIPWLTDRREEYSVNAWDMYEEGSTIAFTEGRQEPKFLPFEVATPLCRLTGYNSIVNTAIFHPHFLHVVTSGVENSVFLHSPTPSSPCTQNLQRAPMNVRQLRDEENDRDRTNYLSALLGEHSITTAVDGVDDATERQTLSLFDFIVRDEGTGNVFEHRRWNTPSSSDSESDHNQQGTDSDSEDTMDSNFAVF